MVAAHSTADLQAENGRLKMENALLREMLRRLRLEKYGRASEKLTDAQLELLEQEPGVQAPEVTQKAELPAEKKEAVAVPAQRRPHPGRTELPAHLPRVMVDLACAPEQCRCGQCGQPTEGIRSVMRPLRGTASSWMLKPVPFLFGHAAPMRVKMGV
jgi:hypothetical protein